MKRLSALTRSNRSVQTGLRRWILQETHREAHERRTIRQVFCQVGMGAAGRRKRSWNGGRGTLTSTHRQGFLEVLHDQYMSLRRLEMDARKYFDEELEVAAEQRWTAGTAHLVELKNWIQELEQWIVAGDASSRLRSGVEDSEARVLRARLRKMGMNPEVVEGEDEWVSVVRLSLGGARGGVPSGPSEREFQAPRT